MNRTNYFKFQGPYLHHEGYLYWSNTDGWVDFDSATLFELKEFGVINAPMEATHVVWVSANGDIEWGEPI